MVKKLLSIILLPFILVACKDDAKYNFDCVDNCITIYGIVTTEEGSIEPVEDASIKLEWKQDTYAPIFGTPKKTVGFTNTDENGFYEFVFEPHDNELEEGSFVLSFSKNHHISGSRQIFISSLLDTLILVDYHLPKSAQISIKINNFQPTEPGDVFYVSPQYNNYMGTTVGTRCSDLDGNFVNAQAYSEVTEYICEAVGNQYMYIDILKKKNGIREDLLDSIMIEPGEIGYYEITY